MCRCLLALFSLWLSLPGLAQNDPLQAVEQSLHVDNTAVQKKKMKELYSERWFDPSTHFAQVFLQDKGAKLLLDWVGAQALGYTVALVTPKRTNDFVSVSAEVKAPDKSGLRIRILVPHPRSLESRELGLMREFAVFEPPLLEYVEKTQVIAPGAKAMLYWKKDGILLHLNVARGGILVLESNNKLQTETIKKYFNELDIERLNAKLS